MRKYRKPSRGASRREMEPGSGTAAATGVSKDKVIEISSVAI